MANGCSCTGEETSFSTVPGDVSLVVKEHASYSCLHRRKGKDYTYLYGSHIGTGSLTPYIARAFDERVEE
jgi:hypothetical protein